MRRLLFAGLFCAALAVAPLAAEGRIQRRQVNQQKRIAGGVASGQLTRKSTTAITRSDNCAFLQRQLEPGVTSRAGLPVLQS